MDQIYKRPDRACSRYDADPELSFTIPSNYYFDADILAQEKHKIFHRSWQFVGHASEVSEAGSYLTKQIADQHVAVVRGRDGALRAFFNVCQHRGHLLLEGKGKLKNVITCPYHAWAYNHSGELVAAPDCDTVANFDKAEFTIPAVHVEEFFGFVFVNLDPRAKPMAECYPGLQEQLAEHFTKPEDLKPHREIVFDIKGNWKNVGDNALECYHCSTAHKDFVDLVDMDTYEVTCHENWSYQGGGCREVNPAYNFEETSTCGKTFLVMFMFPNFFFSKFAGTDGLLTFEFMPTAPEMTHQHLIYYGPDSKMSKTEADVMTYFNDVLGPEDVTLVERVQQGLHSLGYHEGRFIIDKSRGATAEHAVHHFHSLVLNALEN